MERSGRDKVLRGLKTENTPILDGYNIYYNFIRPHMSLNGKTPAEVASMGMNLDENRWLSLIRKALEKRNDKC